MYPVDMDTHASPEISSQTSDGYHTFDELYSFRALLHAHATKAWQEKGWSVFRSTRHADGEECFGGGWFIVYASLTGGRQVSFHYPMSDWELFGHLPTLYRAPKWDGHTAEDSLLRLADALDYL